MHHHERLASMLKDFMRSTGQLKEATIKQNDEDSANTLLSVEYFCQALQSEMLMWLALKKEYPNKTWDYLIDAKMGLKQALTQSISKDFIEKLHQIEKVVFPSPVFNSLSMVIKSVKCSICKRIMENVNISRQSIHGKTLLRASNRFYNSACSDCQLSI
jgi:hypothetical protein